jgi:seryl-tRNA synthetase
MLDLKFVRENPDIVKQNIKNKFQDRKLPLVDEVIELDAKARAVKTEADELRANRNKLWCFNGTGKERRSRSC